MPIWHTGDDRDNPAGYWTIGVEFAVIFLAGVGVGYLLDWWTDSLPGFLLLGAALGFGAALHRLIRQAREIQRRFGQSKPLPPPEEKVEPKSFDEQDLPENDDRDHVPR